MLELGFGNPFPLLGCLALAEYKGRCLVLPPLDKSCFVETHGRLVPFCTETEEWRMGGGGQRRGGGGVHEKEKRVGLYSRTLIITLNK